jgi:uncharacterized protein YjbJ (UPF0337 family)
MADNQERSLVMPGRSEEMKGGIKEGLGKLTGDEALQAEGQAEKERGRARRKTSGAMSEAKGSVKRGAGKAMDSPTLEAEGEMDKRRGRSERA